MAFGSRLTSEALAGRGLTVGLVGVWNGPNARTHRHLSIPPYVHQTPLSNMVAAVCSVTWIDVVAPQSYRKLAMKFKFKGA